jgi:NAD(P) transhydrogenase subunit alpha
MFSGNITAFLSHFWDGESKSLKIDPSDDIMKGCLITTGGKIVHEKFADL